MSMVRQTRTALRKTVSDSIYSMVNPESGNTVRCRITKTPGSFEPGVGLLNQLHPRK
jgi:hypothetical protein